MWFDLRDGEWEYEPTSEQLKEAKYKWFMLEYGVTEEVAKRIVIDFIAGMTDDFFLNEVQKACKNI